MICTVLIIQLPFQSLRICGPLLLWSVIQTLLLLKVLSSEMDPAEIRLIR